MLCGLLCQFRFFFYYYFPFNFVFMCVREKENAGLEFVVLLLTGWTEEQVAVAVARSADGGDGDCGVEEYEEGMDEDGAAPALKPCEEG